jgi:hypothetical protein
MKCSPVGLIVRLGLLSLALLFWTGCANCLTGGRSDFTPTGQDVPITLVLQHPVTETSVDFQVRVGVLKNLVPKPNSNDELYLDLVSVPDATVTPATFTLKKGDTGAHLVLNVTKGKLNGQTLVVLVYDKTPTTAGRKYIGFEPYTIEDTGGRHGKWSVRSPSPIKIKLK